MNETDFGTTAHLAPFFATREASEHLNPLEAWTYSDGVLALTIGVGAVLACVVAAGVIAIAYELGRVS